MRSHSIRSMHSAKRLILLGVLGACDQGAATQVAAVGESDRKTGTMTPSMAPPPVEPQRTEQPPPSAPPSSAPDAAVATGGAPATAMPSVPLERFSFFVTSLRAMQELSGSQDGFGGDLSFGETGEGAGLRGADKICTTIAERSMPGSGQKQWRAFLSTVAGGPDGGPVHAIDRVGEGPWYDRLGRLLSVTKADLIETRPASADAVIKNDFPNEDGVPNHNPDGTGEVDNHDFLTGTDAMGQLFADDPRVTCNDWTKSEPDANDAPRVGHSWPRMGGGPGFGAGGAGGFPPPNFGDGGPGFGGPPPNFGDGGPGMGEFDPANWMSSLNEAGCGPGVHLVEMGPPREETPTVGSGGGYGGIYCFALSP
jgi:hypothetical protein